MSKTVKRWSAKTIYVNTGNRNLWWIFCFTAEGDLFLNGDYWIYGYAWRSFGGSFEEFLLRCDAGYVIQKFENNQISTSGKKIPKNAWSALEELLDEFKKELANNPVEHV